MIDFINDFKVTEIISTLNTMKRNKKINVKLGKVYCYEEIILSSNILKEYINIEEKFIDIYNNIIEDIRDNKNSEAGEDYTLNPKNSVRDYITRKAYKTDVRHSIREKVAADLLRDITKGTPLNITKRKLSECFRCDCCWRDVNNLYREYDRIKCNLYDRDKRISIEEKLNNLIRNSILSRNIDLDYLIKYMEDIQYIDTNYKELLERDISLKEIIRIHDELKDKERYGLDIFERVYNYINLEKEIKKETVTKIKGF